MMTKPHLVSWCERIAVGGRPIDEDRFAELVFRVLDAAERIPGLATSAPRRSSSSSPPPGSWLHATRARTC